MDGEKNIYFELADKISSSLKTPKALEKQAGIAQFLEMKEFEFSVSGFLSRVEFSRSGKSAINDAALYDSLLTVQENSRKALMRSYSKSIEEFSNEIDLTLASAGKELTFEDTNSRLFDYLSSLSDMKVVSETMAEVCKETNKHPLSKAGGSLDGVKPLVERLASRLGSIMDKMKGVLDPIVEEFRKQIDSLWEFTKSSAKDAVGKFKEAFKWISEKLEQFQLSMLEKMFRWVGRIAELAKVNGWSVQNIHVELPEIGVKFEKLKIALIETPIPIPIPEIKQPKASMTFAPIPVKT